MSQIRKIRYRLFAWRWFPELKPAQEPIDVVIPLVAKDLRIFPLCLEGIRNCVPHPIKDIYIVAPPQDEVIQFCKQNGLVFVDESSVFGFNPKEINLKIKWSDGTVRDRSGWFFQQLLKLSGKVGTCRYYLCVDADHVLIRPHVFLTEDYKTVLRSCKKLSPNKQVSLGWKRLSRAMTAVCQHPQHSLSLRCMAISCRIKSDVLGSRRHYVIVNWLTTRRSVRSGVVRAGHSPFLNT